VAFIQSGISKTRYCTCAVRENSGPQRVFRSPHAAAKVATPDLIFLDLSFREMDGLDVLREIKSTTSLVHIPIVVVTGSADPKLVRAVYKLNGNCFIRKPNELGKLLRFIRTCYTFWGSVVTLTEDSSEAER
jgi:CheY-like chemotaxis protein